MVLLEAMSLAKPIVATSVGGVPEVIEHEVTGLTVKTRNHTDVSQAIVRLAVNPEAARQFGENARRRYRRQIYRRDHGVQLRAPADRVHRLKNLNRCAR